MSNIAPNLRLDSGVDFVELHVLDGYGQTLALIELSEQACENLHRLLPTVTPYGPVIDVEATVVQPELDLTPDLVVESGEDPEEAALTTEPVVDAPVEEIPVELTDWRARTKAEIIASVRNRFGVSLEEDLNKDRLIEAATELELASF